MVARLLWEQEARERAAAFGKSGSPWDAEDDGIFPLDGNGSKTDVDYMFDHSWKA